MEIYVVVSRSGIILKVTRHKDAVLGYFAWNNVNGESIRVEVWQLDGKHLRTFYEEDLTDDFLKEDVKDVSLTYKELLNSAETGDIAYRQSWPFGNS